MSVSSLLIFFINKDLNIQICCIFNVLWANIFTVHNSYAQLKFLNWFRFQFPLLRPLFSIFCFAHVLNFDPTVNNTLTQVTVGVMECARFYWLLFERLPMNAIESIVQVNFCIPNKVVAKEDVIVISLDHNHGGTREIDTEGVNFVEFWILHVGLVVFALTKLIIPAIYNQVRI